MFYAYILSEMRGRPAGRFLGDMTTPRRPEESLLQFLVGIFSQNFTLRVSIVRPLKYEHLHIKYLQARMGQKGLAHGMWWWLMQHGTAKRQKERRKAKWMPEAVLGFDPNVRT
jgi:hypothetical protein